MGRTPAQILEDYVKGHLGEEFDVLDVQLESDGYWVGQVWEYEFEVACVALPVNGKDGPMLGWIHEPR